VIPRLLSESSAHGFGLVRYFVPPLESSANALSGLRQVTLSRSRSHDASRGIHSDPGRVLLAFSTGSPQALGLARLGGELARPSEKLPFPGVGFVAPGLFLSLDRKAPVGTPGASWRRVGLDPPRIFALPWSPSLAVVGCFRSFSAMPSRGDKRLTIASTVQ